MYMGCWCCRWWLYLLCYSTEAYLKDLFIYLKGTVREQRGERRREPASSGSLLKLPQQLRLGQIEARSSIWSTLGVTGSLKHPSHFLLPGTKVLEPSPPAACQSLHWQETGIRSWSCHSNPATPYGRPSVCPWVLVFRQGRLLLLSWP